MLRILSTEGPRAHRRGIERRMRFFQEVKEKTGIPGRVRPRGKSVPSAVSGAMWMLTRERSWLPLNQGLEFS